MAHEIAHVLAEADPANAATYEANAEELEGRLDDLTEEVTEALKPVRNRPFIVFHDAYQYFENRFGLTVAGSITISPEVIPGAGRVAEIRETIADRKAVCVFAEPQFEPKLVSTVVEGSDARTGVLDPLGADITPGPDHYFALIRAMAAAFKDCLGNPS